MTYESRSDGELLRLARDEPDAFGVFYRRHVDAMLGYFVLRTRRPDVAADLMAETFAEAFASVHRYRDKRVPAGAWLFAIARNKLADAPRTGQVQDRARRRLALEPVSLDDADLERIMELASDRTVDELLERLPASEAQAIRSHVVDERGYDEIAQELRRSAAVVRKRVSRGLGRLRSEMEMTR